MSKLILIAVITMASIFSMAQSAKPTRAASLKEKKYICKVINLMMEANDVDAAIDMQACVANKKIKAYEMGGGITGLDGSILFRSIAQPKFELDCQLVYKGTIDKPRMITDSFDCQ